MSGPALSGAVEIELRAVPVRKLRTGRFVVEDGAGSVWPVLRLRPTDPLAKVSRVLGVDRDSVRALPNGAQADVAWHGPWLARLGVSGGVAASTALGQQEAPTGFMLNVLHDPLGNLFVKALLNRAPRLAGRTLPIVFVSVPALDTLARFRVSVCSRLLQRWLPELAPNESESESESESEDGDDAAQAPLLLREGQSKFLKDIWPRLHGVVRSAGPSAGASGTGESVPAAGAPAEAPAPAPAPGTAPAGEEAQDGAAHRAMSAHIFTGGGKTLMQLLAALVFGTKRVKAGDGEWRAEASEGAGDAADGRVLLWGPGRASIDNMRDYVLPFVKHAEFAGVGSMEEVLRRLEAWDNVQAVMRLPVCGLMGLSYFEAVALLLRTYFEAKVERPRADGFVSLAGALQRVRPRALRSARTSGAAPEAAQRWDAPWLIICTPQFATHERQLTFLKEHGDFVRLMILDEGDYGTGKRQVVGAAAAGEAEESQAAARERRRVQRSWRTALELQHSATLVYFTTTKDRSGSSNIPNIFFRWTYNDLLAQRPAQAKLLHITRAILCEEEPPAQPAPADAERAAPECGSAEGAGADGAAAPTRALRRRVMTASEQTEHELHIKHALQQLRRNRRRDGYRGIMIAFTNCKTDAKAALKLIKQLRSGWRCPLTGEELKAGVLYSSPTKEEEVRMRQVREKLARGDIDVVVNVGILGRSADYPLINHVLLLAPINSYSAFVQKLGRGIRIIGRRLFAEARARADGDGGEDAYAQHTQVLRVLDLKRFDGHMHHYERFLHEEQVSDARRAPVFENHELVLPAVDAEPGRAGALDAAGDGADNSIPEDGAAEAPHRGAADGADGAAQEQRQVVVQRFNVRRTLQEGDYVAVGILGQWKCAAGTTLRDLVQEMCAWAAHGEGRSIVFPATGAPLPESLPESEPLHFPGLVLAMTGEETVEQLPEGPSGCRQLLLLDTQRPVPDGGSVREEEEEAEEDDVEAAGNGGDGDASDDEQYVPGVASDDGETDAGSVPVSAASEDSYSSASEPDLSDAELDLFDSSGESLAADELSEAEHAADGGAPARKRKRGQDDASSGEDEPSSVKRPRPDNPVLIEYVELKRPASAHVAAPSSGPVSRALVGLLRKHLPKAFRVLAKRGKVELQHGRRWARQTAVVKCLAKLLEGMPDKHDGAYTSEEEILGALRALVQNGNVLWTTDRTGPRQHVRVALLE